ncbi:pyridoxamine 5'-phosphate oxidase-like, FMN-binding [Deinococcus grandis]|uniref:Pyridoxamine 5'-phosphate oxidase-like, FMN-binding n=1 Tax=Deinococcus grandis TaxID=57498 RepID=A0A100HNF4_9DEIO|nr:hypothetical protein [Deinococcus grandis]GAQ23918.1 pyridoxamine 5'-phosphate oxidase-like, FMN-binding [Deinococcus grandis]
MTTYPMTITLSVGQPLVFNVVEPQPSDIEYADEVGRAVESDQQQVSGDGQQEPRWLKFDTWITTGPRPSDRGAAIGTLKAALRFAVRAEIDGLRYDITRIRLVAHAPSGNGYRVSLRMIGPRPDFYSVDANGAFVAYAPLW